MAESSSAGAAGHQSSGVGQQWLSPHDLMARQDVEQNLREGRVHALLTARSYDQSHMGFDGAALLELIDRCRLDAERLRIQGTEVDDEVRHFWQVKLLDRLGAIEIGVTRLLGIPCEFGQYSLQDKTSSHPMFAAIPPLTGPYRRASESRRTFSELQMGESEQAQSMASSDPGFCRMNLRP
jgi:hypothetical protein